MKGPILFIAAVAIAVGFAIGALGGLSCAPDPKPGHFRFVRNVETRTECAAVFEYLAPGDWRLIVVNDEGDITTYDPNPPLWPAEPEPKKPAGSNLKFNSGFYGENDEY